MSVCIDVAWGRWNDLRSAVGSLVGALPSKSEVLVVFSADKPYIAVPFSTVPDAIKHFPDPWKLKAGTPQEFLDSIPVSEAYFVSHAKYPRRAFVLLTSGLPAKDLDNTIHAMLFPGAPFVYVLRMRGLIARRFEPEEQISRNRFGAFAKQLGGIALILSPGETDAADKAAEIALDIDSQYALTYTSRTTPGSDRLHRLSIELPPEMPAVDMQSVPGYYLPAR